MCPLPVALLAVPLVLTSALGQEPAIEFRGRFIDECTLPGETRRDEVVPRQANALQLSADRWGVFYSTHGYRGVDDERSIVYQIRRDAPDGPVVKEGFLVQTINHWHPSGVAPAANGRSYVKQHGHIVACGVPRGAPIDGQAAPHANHFVALWRVLGRPLLTATQYLEKTPEDSELFRKTCGIEWCQFQLNEAGDDLVFTQPVQPFRQAGYETGEQFCEHGDAGWINQSFCPPIPFNARASEWAVADHFAQSRIAAVLLRYQPPRGLYEWVKTGPFIGNAKQPFWEGSLLRDEQSWILAARSSGKVIWARSDDPFRSWSTPMESEEPSVNAPLTASRGADGIIRLVTGDRAASPQKYDRDPLYCWEVAAQPVFATRNRRVVFDSVAARMPFRSAVRSKVDFGELFPLHEQSRTQLLVFGVSTRGYNFPYEKRSDIPPLLQAEKDAAGLYYSTLRYSSPVKPQWIFTRP